MFIILGCIFTFPSLYQHFQILLKGP
ncbi:hypothetical protein DS831_04015 [Bombilactobacillus bombi]|uniref:Uncharacterized protein n=1 Tax=Bombilactobacillus bombi TaxID=1303590 RepID=A0A3R6UZE0_9LACO|nr:hypothetical protein DS831_04015 [Bombilactobacillus bombi]